MKIAQVAPLHERVPPKTYGGTERVVHYLVEALVRKGHEVTLFASGDAQTSAELRPVIPEAIRLAPVARDPLPWHLLQLAQVAREAEDFDVIHFHTDLLHLPLWRYRATPHLTTLHGRLDLPDLKPIYTEFSEAPVVSIADHQREPLPMAGWIGTVYNGLPRDAYTFRADPGDYLVFLGRLSPEKGAEDAIDIALAAGIPLKMAGKVDIVDKAYFADRIRPKLEHPLIELVGEVDEAGKNELLGGALAMLFPIAWPEPFGLVMIESMACGTPVVAYPRGSVPEILRDGETGFLVDSVPAAVQALRRILQLDRRRCREEFARRFTAERMAEDYLALYADRIREHAAPPTALGRLSGPSTARDAAPAPLPDTPLTAHEAGAEDFRRVPASGH